MANMDTLPEKSLKKPISVLVLLHDAHGQILLLERADRAGFWQSVTGSLENDETPFQAALREVAEETGIILPNTQLHDWQHSTVYEIFPYWRHRYPPGVTHNTEHWFSAQIAHQPPTLSEHTAYQWLDPNIAMECVFSPSNRDMIVQFSKRFQAA
jgi:hypothetical protein